MAKSKKGKKQYRSIRRDIRNATKVAENLLPIDPLSRVDDSRSAEIQDLIDQYRATSDPFSSAYAGRRSGELKDFMDRYKESTKGYDSQELAAIRSARRRGIDRGFQSGQAALAAGQGNYRLGGTQRAAQLADLARSYGTQSADAENDMFIANAAEQQRRLEGYGNTIQNVEQSEYDRGTSALKSYRDALETARANEYDRTKLNLGQEAADRAGRVGGIMGVLGIKEARQNAKRQNKLIREGYASNERIAGRNSGGGSSGGMNAYAEALNSIAEELAGQGGGG